MIAVTIGCGPYREMAELAANSVNEQTGLDVIILDDEHLARSGAADPRHLKFHLFDLVDCDNLVYFDADMAFLRPWNPSLWKNREEIVCVRDLPWSIGPEAIRFGIPVFEYFNAGLFIVNREYHRGWLELAERTFEVVRGDLYDQTALNYARVTLGLPLKFLDRRYNCIGYGLGPSSFEIPVCVAHAAGADKDQIMKLLKKEIEVTNEPIYEIDAELTSSLDGTIWEFDQIGHLKRRFELLPGGAIGVGSMDYERFWWAVRTRADRRAILFDSSCEISTVLDEHDGAWSGYSHKVGCNVTLDPIPT